MDAKDNNPSKAARRKRLREAKSGKRDFIEDDLGAEALKGTYEAREKTAKIMAIDRARQKAIDDIYLNKLRKEREEELQSRIFDVETIMKINQRITYILYNTVEPDAFEYLNILRQKNPDLCHKICYCLIPPKDMHKLDDYVDRIYHHGPPKNKIRLNYIIRLERKITGKEPTIQIEKDGERIEFGKAIRGR